jgi:hypothetical protein
MEPFANGCKRRKAPYPFWGGELSWQCVEMAPVFQINAGFFFPALVVPG